MASCCVVAASDTNLYNQLEFENEVGVLQSISVSESQMVRRHGSKQAFCNLYGRLLMATCRVVRIRLAAKEGLYATVRNPTDGAELVLGEPSNFIEYDDGALLLQSSPFLRLATSGESVQIRHGLNCETKVTLPKSSDEFITLKPFATVLSVSEPVRGCRVLSVPAPPHIDDRSAFVVEEVDSVSVASVKARVPVKRMTDLTQEELQLPLSQPNWEELTEDLAAENELFAAAGKLSDGSPRRARNASPPRDLTKPAVAVTAPIAPVLVGLSKLFQETGDAGFSPLNFQGLDLLHDAAQHVAKRVIPWVPLNELQLRIRQRQRDFDQRMKERTEGARRMREEQSGSPQRSTAPTDQTDTLKDQAVLAQLERKIEAEQAKLKQDDDKSKARLEEAKRTVQEQRAARAKAREEKLKQLLDEEEDTIDTLKAAEKVRGAWDETKKRIERGEVDIDSS